MKTFLTIVIATAIVMPMSSFAKEPCRSRGVLRDKLLNYDVEMRTKKVGMRGKRIALMQKDNDLERKMVQIEGQILVANSKSMKDVLQEKYDKVAAQRDSLDKEQERLAEDYAKVVYERIVGRIKLRIASMESKYKCLVEKGGDANKLNAKRDEFKQKMDAKLAELNALQKRKSSSEKELDREQDSIRSSIRRSIRDWRDWLRDFAKALPK